MTGGARDDSAAGKEEGKQEGALLAAVLSMAVLLYQAYLAAHVALLAMRIVALRHSCGQGFWR